MHTGGSGHDGSIIAVGGFAFDAQRLELRDRYGQRVALRPQALAVLQCLAHHSDQLVSRDELMRSVWPDVVVTDDSLAQCIREIRRALQDAEHRIVQTEPKRGYRLVSDGATAAPAVATAASTEPEQQIRFATSADGTRIAYATSGAGAPLLRAPHWMTHLEWEWRSAVFGPWAQGLSRRYRLVRYDGRGCGLSDRDAAAPTLDQSVDDLAAVADAAGLPRFALMGLSGGGAMAIRYAARHPKRVSHLILIGGWARGGLRRGERSISPQTLDAMARLIEEGWGLDTPAFRQMITSLMWPRASVEQMDSFNQLQRDASTPQAAAQLLRAFAEYDASADLPHVRCPTLVLHSPLDARVPFEEGRLVASLIPKARLVALDSPSHTPMQGEPAFDEAHRLIDEFLRSDAAGAATPAHRSSPRALRLVEAPRGARAARRR